MYLRLGKKLCMPWGVGVWVCVGVGGGGVKPPNRCNVRPELQVRSPAEPCRFASSCRRVRGRPLTLWCGFLPTTPLALRAHTWYMGYAAKGTQNRWLKSTQAPAGAGGTRTQALRTLRARGQTVNRSGTCPHRAQKCPATVAGTVPTNVPTMYPWQGKMGENGGKWGEMGENGGK